MSEQRFLPRSRLRIFHIGFVLVCLLVLPAVDSKQTPRNVFAVPAAYAESLIVCASAEWFKDNPTDDSVVYRCKRACPVQDGSQCTYATTDVLGNSLQTIAFVVDSMAGEMRWNSPSRTLAGVFHHGGLNGTMFASDFFGPEIRGLWLQLENEGVRLVEPAWQPGVVALGWFSRKGGNATTLPELTRRPAALIQWARTHLIPDGLKFGTVGCSGGSIATFGPVYWHGLDSIIDYQYLSGALPGVWDIPAVCSLTPSRWGICENDPSTPCANGTSCAGGYACAIPQPTGTSGVPPNPAAEPVKALIDYIAVTDGTCQAGRSNPAFYLSSFKYTPGARSFDHPVDTDVGVGGSPMLLTDTHLGVTYNTGRLFTSIQTSRYKTYSLVPGTHCDSSSDPLYLPDVLNKIRVGLGLIVLPALDSTP